MWLSCLFLVSLMFLFWDRILLCCPGALSKPKWPGSPRDPAGAAFWGNGPAPPSFAFSNADFCRAEDFNFNKLQPFFFCILKFSTSPRPPVFFFFLLSSGFAFYLRSVIETGVRLGSGSLSSSAPLWCSVSLYCLLTRLPSVYWTTFIPLPETSWFHVWFHFCVLCRFKWVFSFF